MTEKETKYQKLEKKLIKKKKSCWEIWDKEVTSKAFSFAENYKVFLNEAKTERESVIKGIHLAKKKGFKDIETVKSLKPGDKVFFNQKGRSLVFMKIGKEKLINGCKLIMTHVDSPHLDFKTSPLYEDENLAFLKSHYYGGIKKYQWTAIPLSLHGVVYLENGEKIEIKIGEKDDEPIFMITDLLPHLDRGGGPGSPIKNREVTGENLNLLVGSIPVKDDKIKQKVKLAVLEYLYNKYKITDEDLVSAELQAVPCGKARDLGFDKSMVAGYGHDDRVCSYAALEAFFDSKNTQKTQMCVWVDREEIGSDGNTGAKSTFFEMLITKILKLQNENYSLANIYKIFTNSVAISGDVAPAVDPDYKDVYDLNNSHRMSFGLAMEKYVGSGGKYMTSEASSEYISFLRRIFNKNKNIIYQISGGLGKIDIGGGGTIAKYMANRNMEIIDMGIPVLNMHAPFEIISKADLYCTYLGYKEFLDS